MLQAIIAILGGAIAASSLIIDRRPSAAGFLKTISEYKGFFGVVLTFWGLRGLFRVIFHSSQSYGGVIGICTYAAEFIVGFLLAYELIQKYLLSNSDKASEVGRDMKSSLSKYQVPAGIALIVLGIMSLF